MSLNSVVSAERLHIGFFGQTNAGKSSLVNACLGQNLSIVSEIKGTTTDPVKKAVEILPLGPVVIIDTPGFNDDGDLGKQRIEKTKDVLKSTDIAVLVVDSSNGITTTDQALIDLFKEKDIPYIIAFNKSDINSDIDFVLKDNEIFVSAKNGYNIEAFKEMLAKIVKFETNTKKIVADLLHENDTVILVIPIDESAPKGRIILPQQQVLRELLDANCNIFCCKESNLKETLFKLKEKPALVITDSQVFKTVADIVPREVPLTSFSILFARYKGNLNTLINGAKALKNLKDNDKVLISEGCTHHRQCNDIGTVKLPNMIKKYTNADLNFSFTSGGEFPSDTKDYNLIVHCGGCMLNEKQMKNRIATAEYNGTPIVNYGVAIALMSGILERSIEIFKKQIKI